MVYVVSKSEAVLDLVKAALKTSAVVHVSDSNAYLTAVMQAPRGKGACVIVDLGTVPDADRLIAFTKASPLIARFPIIVIGSDHQLGALSDEVHPLVNGFVTRPYTAVELAVVVASVCDEEPPGGTRESTGL